MLLNIIWLIVTGLPMAAGSALMGALLCVTIVGIPFGLQHFKIAKLALMPFGSEIFKTQEKSQTLYLLQLMQKYIHSNLAVYCLRAFAKPYQDEITVAEYTINQQTDDILMDLYKQNQDLFCFSCYIWNIEYVEQNPSAR